MSQSLLFFWQAGRYISPEWLGSASGIAITYIIFVMGLPSLIFQTFIPEGQRNIYNERFKKEWEVFFISQLGLAVLIFFLGNPRVSTWLSHFFTKIQFGQAAADDSAAEGEFYIAVLIFAAVVFILYQGYFHLMRNFKSTRNIAQRIANAIVKEAIKDYDLYKEIDKKDLDDLSALAKELKAGQLKNEFLEECECLLEHILNAPPHRNNDVLVKRLLEDVVCMSVMYDGSESNQDNRHKVLDILNLVNGHKMRPKVKKKTGLLPKGLFGRKALSAAPLPVEHQNEVPPQSSSDYSRTHIGYLIKELGIDALKNGDVKSALEAVEQLYSADADPKETFAIGSYAVRNNMMGAAVSAFQKLRSKLQESTLRSPEPSKHDLRVFYFWAGIMALLYQRDGSAKAHALQRWQSFREKTLAPEADVVALFRATHEHFVRLTDFDTADAVGLVERAQAER